MFYCTVHVHNLCSVNVKSTQNFGTLTNCKNLQSNFSGNCEADLHVSSQVRPEFNASKILSTLTDVTLRTGKTFPCVTHVQYCSLENASMYQELDSHVIAK